LECRKANTNLPAIRLFKFSECKKYGFFKVSVNRTVPSDLFDCRPGKREIFCFQLFRNKILYFSRSGTIFVKKKFVEKYAESMSILGLVNIRDFDN